MPIDDLPARTGCGATELCEKHSSGYSQTPCSEVLAVSTPRGDAADRTPQTSEESRDRGRVEHRLGSGEPPSSQLHMLRLLIVYSEKWPLVVRKWMYEAAGRLTWAVLPSIVLFSKRMHMPASLPS